MISALLWYIIVTAIGAAAWPIAFRFLPGLPDRGFTFSRALGLLLGGYVFWLLTSLGLLRNSIGGILFALTLVMAFSVWAYFTRPDKTETISGWIGSHGSLVVVTEVLFLVAFASWVVVRAYNPELDSTERPMELMFLNGIRASSVFPPIDPWLSGYSISYYYFGYVIMAMLAELSATATAVAFNLGIALLFALTVIGVYGLVYNLVRASRKEPQGGPVAVTALVGPLLTVIMGNLEGLFELIRSINFPPLDAGFWAWLDIEAISGPVTSIQWPPDQWRFWWWWQASRVIQDRTPAGVAIGLQPIDEFPMFSFLLGDMHPHVLALPFVVLALGLAFNLLTQKEKPTRVQYAIYTVCFGALAFLNTWDLPIYLFILIGAMVIRAMRDKEGATWLDIARPIAIGIGILAVGVLAYLPWYVTFTSQAGGVLPNALFPTRFHQFFVMFGPFLVILIWFLIDHAIHEWRSMDWSWGFILGGSILATLIGVAALGSIIGINNYPEAKGFLLSSTVPSQDPTVDPVADALGQAVSYRLSHPTTPLVLTGILVVVIAALFAVPRSSGEDASEQRPQIDLSRAFVLLLIFCAVGLTLVPEFAYLRDNFGQRLNTVFKFYYAAWLLFSIASAYALNMLIARGRSVWVTVGGVVVGLLILAGMVYPAFAIPTKMAPLVRTERDAPPTLNGIAFIQRRYPSDYNAILWLQKNAPKGSVVLEAVGGSYTIHGRVSVTTGLPTVIGWPGHESQWRGQLFGEIAGGRESDVREIYNTSSLQRAHALLTKYNVTYVFVGSQEMNESFATPGGLAKFDRMMKVVFQDGDVKIYQFDPTQNGAQP